MNDEKISRYFALGLKDHPTHIEVCEMEDGSINISLCTKRDGMENLTTGFRVSAKTFELLTWALARAAHDETAWQKNDENT